jgi:hypothetical protein
VPHPQSVDESEDLEAGALIAGEVGRGNIVEDAVERSKTE